MENSSQKTNLQPLVDGLSCSELSRLKAFELLGGDGLWELELRWRKRTAERFATESIKTNDFAPEETDTEEARDGFYELVHIQSDCSSIFFLI